MPLWRYNPDGTEQPLSAFIKNPDGSLQDCRVYIKYPDGSVIPIYGPETLIDGFEQWPTGWDEPSGQTRDVVQSADRALEGTYSLKHPAGSGFDRFYSQPGGGLGAYPGVPSRHRSYWWFDTSGSGSPFWYFLRQDSGNKLALRLWSGTNQIVLQDYNGGSSNDVASDTVTFPSKQWLELDIKCDDGQTFGLGTNVTRVDLNSYNPATGDRSLLASVSYAFRSALATTQAGVELTAGDGDPLWYLDNIQLVQ